MTIPDCFSPSRYKGFQERAENLCEWCPVVSQCFPQYRKFPKDALANEEFTIGDTWRSVVRNPTTNRQVAVISMSPGKVSVSAPVEGMAGWTIHCKSLDEAMKIAYRECRRSSKVYNRLVEMPMAFLKGRLN